MPPAHRRSPVQRLSGRWGAFVLALLLASPGAAPAAQDELALKAAIVFNLLQFVQWPVAGAAEAPLVLCAERTGAMWWHLQALVDRPLAGGRALQVRALTPSADGAAGCHATFVESAGVRLPDGAPTLVITDVARGEMPGGVVGLRRAGERIGFEIDLAAARRAGLQVSSKLLRLATRVRE